MSELNNKCNNKKRNLELKSGPRFYMKSEPVTGAHYMKNPLYMQVWQVTGQVFMLWNFWVDLTKAQQWPATTHSLDQDDPAPSNFIGSAKHVC